MKGKEKESVEERIKEEESEGGREREISVANIHPRTDDIIHYKALVPLCCEQKRYFKE